MISILDSTPFLMNKKNFVMDEQSRDLTLPEWVKLILEKNNQKRKGRVNNDSEQKAEN